MALLHPFSGTEAKAKEPINEDLMDKKYKENIEDLATQVGTGGSGGGGGGLEALALQNVNLKNGIVSVLPNNTSMVQPFTNESNLQIWLRKTYDASADTTTMYLDHGLDYELETVQDFETIGDFTAGANTPTIAADTTNFIEGTQSIKMSKATLNGSIDITEVVDFGLLDRNFRVSFYPDTLSNVVRAYVKLETSLGNDVTYYFPVANMTAVAYNNFTVNLNLTPDASNGTFERATITKVYYGFTTNSAQTVNVSWDLARLISDKPLFPVGYTLELPIQDNDHQEMLSIISVDAVDPSKYTLSASATYDYPNGLSKANLEVAYISNQTGTVDTSIKQQVHKVTASGEAAKSAITSEILYLAETVANGTLESFTRFFSNDTFEVTNFPTTTTLEISSATDKSGYFLDNDYFFLFKKQRGGYKNQSFKGTDGSNFQYLQLSTDATFSSDTITLTHGGDNSVGSDDTGYFVVRAEVLKSYIAGAKNANTFVDMTPTEFLPIDDSIQFFPGITSYWKCDNRTGALIDSKATNNIPVIGSPTSTTGKFGAGKTGFSSANYYRGYLPSLAIGGAPNLTKQTVEGWVIFDSITTAQFLFYNSDATTVSTALTVHVDSSTLYFGRYDAGQFSNVNISAYNDGKLHYFVGVFDNTSTSGTKKWIYIDGASVGSVENSDTEVVLAAGYVGIGGGNDGAERPWLGTLDDMVYWNGAAMTSDQIAQRYANGIGKRYAPHTGYIAKYKAINLSSVEKLAVYDQLTRSDTTNQNPSNIETNSLIY